MKNGAPLIVFGLYNLAVRRHLKTWRLGSSTPFSHPSRQSWLPPFIKRFRAGVLLSSSWLTINSKVQAKQIISFDEEKKLKLNKVELDNILNQENVKGLPIVVLSVVGSYRTGKSFLLSWLVRYFKADVKDSSWLEQYKTERKLSQSFKWRSGSQAETQGIWVSPELFILDGPEGQKVGVLLLDTQGLFDGNNTTKQNGNIFTLSTLMSSIQIFNLSQKMQEDNLENLQIFSEYGRLALSKENSSSNNVKPFQRIIFLIRDWSNPKEHSFGPKGGKKYIKNYLDTTQREEGTELGGRRRQILQLFSKVECYLMPKPGEKIETDKSDDNSRLSDMNTDFKDHLKDLPFFLFRDAIQETKKVAGTPILAGELADHVEFYVNLLNSDDSLSPQSMSQAMVKLHNDSVVKNARKEYKAYVTSIEENNVEIFLTDADIITKHIETKTKAVHYFERHQMGDEKNNTAFLNELENNIDEEFENWKVRNKLAKAETEKLNNYALKEAKKMYSSSMIAWLSDKNPFSDSDELMQKHQEVQKTSTNDLKPRLKGPDEFTASFTSHLEQFANHHYDSVIVPKNERKRKEAEENWELAKAGLLIALASGGAVVLKLLISSNPVVAGVALVVGIVTYVSSWWR